MQRVTAFYSDTSLEEFIVPINQVEKTLQKLEDPKLNGKVENIWKIVIQDDAIPGSNIGSVEKRK